VGPGKLRSGDRITLNDREFVFMSRQAAPGEPDTSGTLAG
jgi:hypothetical protein